jgi:SAM-dependent methyltransferase
MSGRAAERARGAPAAMPASSSAGATSRAGSADAAALAARLEAYYTRYYRDALGIPGWRELVAVRLDDAAHEDRRAARLAEALGRPLAGLALLNVGCGTGGFNAAAARAGAAAWGVDVSADAVAIAAARAPAGRIARAAAEDLPFPDGAFDVVYCYSTLEHVSDALRALGEMARVLRPGGALYLHTPGRWAAFETHYKVLWLPGLPAAGQRAYLRLRGRPTGFLATLRLFSFTECRRMLAAAGAPVERVLDEGARRPVPSRLWPLIRAYYQVCRVRPHVELLAVKGGAR